MGVNDMMSLILWTRYFLNYQGYEVNDNIVFQDNKSTMLLERNGKTSSGKRTCDILADISDRQRTLTVEARKEGQVRRQQQ